MSGRILDGIAAAGLTLAMAILCWSVLAPEIGFDDANITQAYARNILAGHGYVYNVGGERVEGSSSLLWTLVNVAAFAVTSAPERLLAIVGAVLTMVILLSALETTRRLFASAGLPDAFMRFVVLAVFANFPVFFAWSIASLMDLALWIALVTLLFGALVALLLDQAGRRPLSRAATILIVSALVPLCRPEGVAAAVGLCALSAVAMLSSGRSVRVPLGGALVALASLAVVTIWREFYFGQPFPNTAYAKVSLDIGEQTLTGWRYTLDFLGEPAFASMLGMACTGALAGIVSAEPRCRKPFAAVSIVTALFVAAILAVYTLLGGDHFAGHRFYLVLLPLVAPFAALLPAVAIEALAKRVVLSGPKRLAIVVAAVAVPLVAVPASWSAFRDARGYVSNELRIAEVGREIGRRLSALPPGVTVGVIPSGGIRMGYSGPVLDLLGLNWVEMAHAEHFFAGKLKNHGGFNTEVLMNARPDIVHPMLQSCDEAQIRTNIWVNQFLDDLFAKPAFNDTYVFECWNGLAMFVRRDATSLIALMNPT